ncbi:MAG: hypothetical protein QME52_06360 [Bacteroidota bacterium]|nr:hypothetical protein [Bacteroidota bacterium]
MSRGGVYYHSHFPFHDGETGQKRFVILNEPTEDEPYLVVKTTTNLRNKIFREGCNQQQGVFYLPANKERSFPHNTLIQLLNIYEFSTKEFLAGHLTEKVISPLGNLSALTITQIINCIKQLKDDVDEQYFRLIIRK